MLQRSNERICFRGSERRCSLASRGLIARDKCLQCHQSTRQSMPRSTASNGQRRYHHESVQFKAKRCPCSRLSPSSCRDPHCSAGNEHWKQRFLTLLGSLCLLIQAEHFVTGRCRSETTWRATCGAELNSEQRCWLHKPSACQRSVSKRQPIDRPRNHHLRFKHKQSEESKEMKMRALLRNSADKQPHCALKSTFFLRQNIP